MLNVYRDAFIQTYRHGDALLRNLENILQCVPVPWVSCPHHLFVSLSCVLVPWIIFPHRLLDVTPSLYYHDLFSLEHQQFYLTRLHYSPGTSVVPRRGKSRTTYLLFD